MTQLFPPQNSQVLSTFKRETDICQVKHVSDIYHVGRQTLQLGRMAIPSEHLEYCFPKLEGTSFEMSLFGVRKRIGNRLPTISPHGSYRAILPVTDVLEDENDYLLPLKEDGPSGRRVESLTHPGNFHFEFLYVKENDMKDLRSQLPGTLHSWYEQWRLRNNCYIQIHNGAPTVSYEEIDGQKAVWYDILVPYKIELGEETRFDTVRDTEEWGNRGPGIRSVTEVRTAFVAYHCFD